MTPRPPAVDAWEQADRRLDLSTMKQQLAADVRLVSPLTDAFTFDGPDEVIGVFESAFEVLRDIEVHRVTGADRDWVLWGKNTLRGRNLEEIQWLHLDEEGLIDEITLFVRPVAAAADLLARIGGPMARRGLMNERLIGGASLLAAVPAGQLAVAEKRILPRLKS